MVDIKNTLIVDAGARGHALAEDAANYGTEKVVIAPGNLGMKYILNKTHPDLEVIIADESNLKDPQSILKVAKDHNITFANVAQDDTLAAGTADILRESGISTFGVSKSAAKVESDKAWMREKCKSWKVPIPGFEVFSDLNLANKYLNNFYNNSPNKKLWIKASGLAGGKGALDANSLEEAYSKLNEMQNFGESASRIVIEENMAGIEFSAFAIVDGLKYEYLGLGMDHKRALDSDLGDQTGGMAAIFPGLLRGGEIEDKILSELIEKTLDGLHSEGINYQGILYVGGMQTSSGPQIVEYNVRHGDPEVLAYINALDISQTELAIKTITGNLDSGNRIMCKNKFNYCLVGATPGYPGDISENKGKRLLGLDDLIENPDVGVYSAGLSLDDSGEIILAGGRAVSIVTKGKTIFTARDKGQAFMKNLKMDDGKPLHFRTDPGSPEQFEKYVL